MEVKIKMLSSEASIPCYSKPGDAGMDLVTISEPLVSEEKQIDGKRPLYIEYKTGLAIEIPKGYMGLIFPRSSNSKKGLLLANSVGVIDSQYRGEICCRFKMVDKKAISYSKGDKIAQLIIIPYPKIELKVVDELSETERGEGGFGSTGK